MRLVNLLAISISILPLATSVTAKSYVLKCTTVEGYPRVDLAIDLDQKRMTWGIKQYTISYITDEYITGINTYYDLIPEQGYVHPNPVGGEIFVLDRFSGVYKRAWVGLFCKDASPNCPGGSTVLRAETMTGKYMRSMF
jgi:hypothetical protein